jgi:hypothetical protein
MPAWLTGDDDRYDVDAKDDEADLAPSDMGIGDRAPG